jgi:hypothetical protein
MAETAALSTSSLVDRRHVSRIEQGCSQTNSEGDVIHPVETVLKAHPVIG